MPTSILPTHATIHARTTNPQPPPFTLVHLIAFRNFRPTSPDDHMDSLISYKSGLLLYSGTSPFVNLLSPLLLSPFLTSESPSGPSGTSVLSCSARNFSASSAAMHPVPGTCQHQILKGFVPPVAMKHGGTTGMNGRLANSTRLARKTHQHWSPPACTSCPPRPPPRKPPPHSSSRSRAP